MILAFYLWVAVLSWLYLSFFKIHTKFEKQRNIQAYVVAQLKEMIELPHISKLSALHPYVMKRPNRKGLSRTGFDLNN